jgi:transcriptional regulator with XRE-family HTH domain
LPFCHFEFQASRPKSARYPKELNSLGDHIRARRLDLKLLQKQIAEQIGVHEQTITGWECNATVPEDRYLPIIIQFLGYNPLPPATEFPKLLVRTRRMLGLSQRNLAERIGVNPVTIEDWEAGRHRPTGKSLDLIAEILRNQ